MKTLTVTDAKKQLGALLKRAVAGEEIGIISGGEIIALRRVEVTARKEVRTQDDAQDNPSARVQEGEARYAPNGDPCDPLLSWFPDITPIDGGPTDGAANHDQYIYGHR